MVTDNAKLDRFGRLQVSAKIRKAANWSTDATLVLSVDEQGTVHIRTRNQLVREIQEKFRHLRKPGKSIVGEFLKERRSEAEADGF